MLLLKLVVITAVLTIFATPAIGGLFALFNKASGSNKKAALNGRPS